MALPSKIDLQIVTPDRLLVHEQVDELQIPGANGYFGVLPGHAPLLAGLSVGELWYRQGQEKTYLFVAFGFAEVLPDRVTVLARLAERPEEVDVSRADAARKRAEERLGQHRTDVDYERARISLLKATVRLQVSTFARAGTADRARARG